MEKNKTYLGLWDASVLAGSIIAALIIPLQLVLTPEFGKSFSAIGWIITGLFGADVVVSFLRPRVSSWHESWASSSWEKKLWLSVDIVAAIPFFAFPVPRSLQLLRLVKVMRVFQFMRWWLNRRIQSANKLQLLFFAFWLIVATHWIACTWIVLHGPSTVSDDASRYVESLYFTVTTLTTVGYGDIAPAGNTERLFVIGIMLLGVGMYGYVIGNVASILTRVDPARAHYLENLEKLTSFMRYRTLPAGLQRRIHEYYAYLWEKRLGYDEFSMISTLPPTLMTEVSLFLKRDIIEKVPLFKGASEDFVRDIALHMTPVVYMPGDYVFKAGDPAQEMYFISRGHLEVISQDGARVLSTLTEGDFFGEIALVLNQPRSANVRAVEYCDLYRLDREIINQILPRYPNVAMQIKARAKERHERR